MKHLNLGIWELFRKSRSMLSYLFVARKYSNDQCVFIQFQGLL